MKCDVMDGHAYASLALCGVGQVASLIVLGLAQVRAVPTHTCRACACWIWCAEHRSRSLPAMTEVTIPQRLDPMTLKDVGGGKR